MYRSLIHFWRIHIAVLLGTAVATAVLTGALLVGDSVRGSLRDLTVDRLGRIDYALVSEQFFREELAANLLNAPALANQFEDAVPAILLGGTAINTDTRAHASRVQIQGIDEGFLNLWSDSETANLDDFLAKQPRQSFPSVIINQSLQKELNVRVGASLLISFERQGDIHREFLLGRRDSSDVVQTLRFTITKIIPDRGIGRFSLRSNQNLPLNAYVHLPILQKAIRQKERVNAVFVSQSSHSPDLTNDVIKSLQNRLHQVLKLEDLNLMLRQGYGYFSLESKQFLLKPNVIEVAKAAAIERQMPFLPILTYLANTIATDERWIPYSTISALDPERAVSLRLRGGSPAPALEEDEILINEWAAEDLAAKVGDQINVSYYVIGPREELLTQHAQFRLKGVLALEGLAADRELTPNFPGVHDADDMSDWNAPFPINLSQIRSQDEIYWDLYRATPKAFVSEETGQRLWRSRFGSLTAMWIMPASSGDIQQTKADFQKGLLEKICPEQVGFLFQPVKAQGLKAATGATDFSMLFIGFSLFLIVSAVLLVGLLFRLGVEGRVGEIGLLLSSGYPISTIRLRFIKEGCLLAGVGGVIGLGGAAIYAWLLMVGLRSWWLAAVGTPFLVLHINPLSLGLGYFIAIIVVLLSIGWTVRKFGKSPVRALLAGDTILEHKTAGRFAPIFAFASLGLAAGLILFALVSGKTSSAPLFFGSGALLLAAGLAFFSIWLRTPSNSLFRSQTRRIVQMGARNSARHKGRSMLCAALVGCACFVIVAAGANRHSGTEHDSLLQKESGTGGFALTAESDVPLHHNLNSEKGRFELGFSESDAAIVNQSEIIQFRVLPGEDISCLNLYQPRKPRILGVPGELIERGGFQFQGALTTTPEDSANPWRMLEVEDESGVIPAIGDYNSVLWILHLGLGEDLIVQNEFGEALTLRLVGLLRSSIFQSELLISEANFKKHFPSQSGYSYFLIQPPSEKGAVFEPSEGPEEMAQILEYTLSDYGFDVTSTTEKLANYRAVENTYLSTFQTLGGLGLLLGTLGLGVVLLRNVIERRGELATLRAFGFRRSTLSLMLLAENGFLLVVSMLVGSFSAIVAVSPHVIAPGAHIPWLSLAITLIAVFLVGIVASAVSVFFALRTPLLPMLKAE